MTVVQELQAEAVRVRAYRERRRWEEVDREAARTVPTLDQAIERYARLHALASLPADMCPNAAAFAEEARAGLTDLLQHWSSVDTDALQPGDLVELNRRAAECSAAVADRATQVEQETRRSLTTYFRASADARFLADQLGVATDALRSACDEFEGCLLQARRVLDRQTAQPPDRWEAARTRFEAASKPESLLRRAQLPEALAGVLRRLLTVGELTLEEVAPDDLLALRKSPALARLCRLRLPREVR
jgi:hypothetical protein